jgi:hypothetical protein
MVSIGRPRDRFCVTLTEEQLRAIVVRVSTKKVQESSIADVERVMKSFQIPDSNAKAPTLFQMLPDIKSLSDFKILTTT